ncbi:MAG: hypothetical protein QOE35_2141 [Actinomycetota bacterium]
MRARRNTIQRSVAALAALMGALLLTTASASSESTGFQNGTAAAQAQAIKVNPTAAALSIGVTLGTSLAGYTNEVAKAESRGIDLGIIGTTLAGAGCDGSAPSFPADQQPQPLSVDSRDPDAAAGKSGPETISGNPVPVFTKIAKATPQPLGEASALVASVGQAGALVVSGAQSSAKTEVVDGKTRLATASADIKSIDIGGVVKLSGLHWEVTNKTGAEKASTGSFGLGSLSIAGVPVPLGSNDPSAAFAAANQALNALGIELRPPTVHSTDGNVSIDPLAIAVVPNATRDGISGQLLGAALPVRQAVTDALLQQSCKNGTYITIADIAVGSITGAGSFSLELGGAQASTGELTLSNFLQQPPALGVSDANLSDVLSAGAVADVPGSLGTPGTPGTPGQPGQPVTHQAAPIAATSAAKNSKLAVVAGATLLLLAAVAELDRRKMRRAQTHLTPSEA